MKSSSHYPLQELHIFGEALPLLLFNSPAIPQCSTFFSARISPAFANVLER
jgi:hypothetical protein